MAPAVKEKAAPGVSALILAGGLSRRMGQDKASLSWQGKPLLAHVVGILKPVAKAVYVVARPGQSLPELSVPVLTDRIEGAGPLGGLEAGLAEITTPYAILTGCDMPWLNPALLQAMVRLAPGYEAVVPVWEGKLQPLHAVYARKLQPKAARLLAQGERRMQAWVEQLRTRRVEEPFLRQYDPSCLSLQGLNDPQSYQAAQEKGNQLV